MPMNATHVREPRPHGRDPDKPAITKPDVSRLEPQTQPDSSRAEMELLRHRLLTRNFQAENPLKITKRLGNLPAELRLAMYEDLPYSDIQALRNGLGDFSHTAMRVELDSLIHSLHTDCFTPRTLDDFEAFANHRLRVVHEGDPAATQAV
jgi:hypothetical protein